MRVVDWLRFVLDLFACLEKGDFGMVLPEECVAVYAISDLAWKPEERGPQLVGGSAGSSVSDATTKATGS